MSSHLVEYSIPPVPFHFCSLLIAPKMFRPDESQSLSVTTVAGLLEYFLVRQGGCRK